MDVIDGLASPHVGAYSFRSDPFRVGFSSKELPELSRDSQLWEAFKLGSKQAYELMFKQHYSILLNYGLRFTQSEDDVKDYIQQLFTRLWETKERLGENDSIKSYLIASLRRMILKGSKQRFTFLDLEYFSSSFHINLSVENKFFKNETHKDQAKYLSKVVNDLPRRQKEAIYLKYYADHSFDEISEIMGISKRVVYKLIYKAINNLTSRIGKNERFRELLS